MMQEIQRQTVEFQRLLFEQFTSTSTNDKTKMPSTSTFLASEHFKEHDSPKSGKSFKN